MKAKIFTFSILVFCVLLILLTFPTQIYAQTCGGISDCWTQKACQGTGVFRSCQDTGTTCRSVSCYLSGSNCVATVYRDSGNCSGTGINCSVTDHTTSVFCGAPSGGGGGEYCGNGSCGGGESCSSCPGDCGQCNNTSCTGTSWCTSVGECNGYGFGGFSTGWCATGYCCNGPGGGGGGGGGVGTACWTFNGPTDSDDIIEVYPGQVVTVPLRYVWQYSTSNRIAIYASSGTGGSYPVQSGSTAYTGYPFTVDVPDVHAFGQQTQTTSVNFYGTDTLGDTVFAVYGIMNRDDGSQEEDGCDVNEALTVRVIPNPACSVTMPTPTGLSPSNGTVMSYPGSNQQLLSWNDVGVANALYFLEFYPVGGNCASSGATCGYTPNNQATVPLVANNTQYRFRVTSANYYCVPNQSNPSSFNTFTYTHPVTGGFYLDPNNEATVGAGGICQLSGATATSLGTGGSLSGTGYNSWSATQGNGRVSVNSSSYSMNMLYWVGGNNVLSLNPGNDSNGLAYTCTCPVGCQYSGVGSPQSGVNFFLSPAASTDGWWQSIGGSVFAGSGSGVSLSSTVPDATTCDASSSCVDRMITEDADGTANSAGIAITGGGAIDTQDDPGNQSTKVSERSPQITAIGSSPSRVTEGYDYFYRLVSMGLNPTDDFSSSANDAQEPTGPPADNKPAYFHSGDLTIQSPWSVSGNESYVIFVDGNLIISDPGTLQQLITVSAGGGDDSDSDGLVDAWEVQYFGNTTAQNGSGNPDGDSCNNECEESAGTNPTNSNSRPNADTDGDGLSDPWEVQYFGNIGTNSGSSDPDGDNCNNSCEERNGTNPNDANSKPYVYSSTGNGGFLAFIVSGNIIIEDTVGNTTLTDLTPNIEGIFIADGTITVESRGESAGGDNRFIGAGTFVGWGGIVLERDFSDGGARRIENSDKAVETFIYRPDFVRNVPDELARPRYVWQETN